MTSDSRILDTLTNEAQYIAQLMEMPDSTLAKKLSIIRQQMEMAYEKQLTTALETLSLWERQIIEARFMKNDFEDTPSSKTARKEALQEQTAASIEEVFPEEIAASPPPEPAPAKPAQLVLFG